MSHALIEQKLRSLHSHPTEKKFRWLRRFVMAEGDYDPGATAIVRLDSRVGATDPVKLLQEMERLPWFWQLCPRLHFVQARAYEALDRKRRMSDCVARMQSCLQGLLATGDGSGDAPFAVTFLTDQRDILQVIGEDLRYQQLVQLDDRCCDVITSHAGNDVWFDVTELLERLTVPVEAIDSRIGRFDW